MAKELSGKGAAKAIPGLQKNGKSVAVPMAEARRISSGPKPFKSTRGKGTPKGC